MILLRAVPLLDQLAVRAAAPVRYEALLLGVKSWRLFQQAVEQLASISVN